CSATWLGPDMRTPLGGARRSRWGGVTRNARGRAIPLPRCARVRFAPPFASEGGGKARSHTRSHPLRLRRGSRRRRGGMFALASTQQRRHGRAGFLHAGTSRCRERDHLRTRAVFRDFTLDFALAGTHLRARQLVGLAEQHQARQFDRRTKGQHLPVERRRRVADVRNQHESPQRLALAQVSIDFLFPVLAQGRRHLGVTVTGQVHQPASVRQREHDKLLRTPRRLAGAGQSTLVGERVDRAGLARVRAPGEGDFGARVRWKLVEAMRRQHEGRTAQWIVRCVVTSLCLGPGHSLAGMTCLTHVYPRGDNPAVRAGLCAGAHALREREDSMGFRRSAAVLVMLAAAAPIAVALSAPPTRHAKPAASAPAASAPASASTAAAPASAASAGAAAKAAEAEFDKLAAVATKPGDATAGQAKAAACGACHGMDGNSSDAQYPKLAGQSQQYIVTQLMRFKSGVRQNAIMQGMAATLAPQDMHDVGAYFAEQKRLPGVADSRLASDGEKLYREGDSSRGIPACMA